MVKRHEFDLGNFTSGSDLSLISDSLQVVFRSFKKTLLDLHLTYFDLSYLPHPNHLICLDYLICYQLVSDVYPPRLLVIDLSPI